MAASVSDGFSPRLFPCRQNSYDSLMYECTLLITHHIWFSAKLFGLKRGVLVILPDMIVSCYV